MGSDQAGDVLCNKFAECSCLSIEDCRTINFKVRRDDVIPFTLNFNMYVTLEAKEIDTMSS